MIENLIIMAVMISPVAAALAVASIAIPIADKAITKKQRAQRKAEHQAQADADMAEMQKVYYEVLFTEIMKGN